MTAGHTAGPIEMVKEEINNFIDSPSYNPLSLLSFIHPLDKDIGKPLAFKAKIGTIFTIWRRSLEMACQRRTGFRCKRNKGIYYQKFRCNQEGGGRSRNDTRVASTARCNQES